ncbi:MAG: hypothetical protein JJT95_05095 [Pararhodobacter sp.]|nr:hypothetical protein [Pararhodobacter sp.]
MKAMNEPDTDFRPPKPARGDEPAQRHCLRCKTAFASEGFGERICKRCKGQASWKSAIPTGDGGSRRRSAR